MGNFIISFFTGAEVTLPLGRIQMDDMGKDNGALT
jgi:hypothetical protein